MKSVFLTVDEAQRDLVSAELWEYGTAGITEEPDGLRAFFPNEADLSLLLQSLSVYRPSVFEEEDVDWVAHSQAQWQPLAVGERFYLVPDWRDDPAPCGRIRLKTHPGMACGTGAHPATRLCLLALERMGLDGCSVLDVGTGSGILAEAAHLLGAEQVFACDIDHASSLIAQRNLDLGMYRVPLFTGSVRSVASGSLDLVLANLNVATLGTMADELSRVLKPTGRRVLSGFREDEQTEVIRLFGKPTASLQLDGWASLVF